MKESLVKRVFTAGILLPLIILGIYFLPPLSFVIVSAFLILVAATEWPKLIGKHSLFNVMAYVCIIIIFMAISSVVVEISNNVGGRLLLLAIYVSIIFSWFLALFWILQYNRTRETPTHNPYFYGAWGIWILVPCWLGLNVIRLTEEGRWFVLYLLLLVWGADTAAYFIGKNYGKKPLVKNVSPKKTWEGFYAALVWAILASVISSLFLPVQRFAFIVLSIITVLFSIVGDLFISVLKRQQKLKDTGTLLPGHGGMLDRIDSLTAAAPIFALGLLSGIVLLW